PEHRLIATKKFELPAAQMRRLAHKVADEVVMQFTGEPGVADTKIAYVSGPTGAKEIVMADYDGVGGTPVTRNGSINLSPVWSPDARSLAFTSFRQGYPDLYRAFPFERRPGQPDIWIVDVDGSNPRRLTSGGDNQGPTWAPNGRHLAFQSNRLGRWQVFAMLADGSAPAPLTRGQSESTSPSWSPRLP